MSKIKTLAVLSVLSLVIATVGLPCWQYVTWYYRGSQGELNPTHCCDICYLGWHRGFLAYNRMVEERMTSDGGYLTELRWSTAAPSGNAVIEHESSEE